MRYKGKIGEFKVSGFVLSLALCLGFAYFIYSRLNFVTEPAQRQGKTTADETLRKVGQLEMQVSDLKAQLSVLQKQVPPIQKTRHQK